MQLFRLSSIVAFSCAALFSTATASPVSNLAARAADEAGFAGDIAQCETQAAAAQVACTEACKADPGCIVGCAATAVGQYTSCVGL